MKTTCPGNCTFQRNIARGSSINATINQQPGTREYGRRSTELLSDTTGQTFSEMWPDTCATARRARSLRQANGDYQEGCCTMRSLLVLVPTSLSRYTRPDTYGSFQSGQGENAASDNRTRQTLQLEKEGMEASNRRHGSTAPTSLVKS